MGFIIFLAAVCLLSITVVRRFFTSSVWDGKTRINIILNLDRENIKSENPFFEKYPATWLVSYEPAEDKLAILLIPDNVWVDLIHGYGSYRAQSIYPLGLIEGNAGNFFQNSFSYFLGLPIDGWGAGLDQIAGQSRFSSELTGENLKKILSAYFLQATKGNIDTNLSSYDCLRLYWSMKKIDVREVKIIDLAQFNVTNEDNLPDGSKILRLDSARFDRLASSEFVVESIKKEGFDIAVFNTTGVNGIGARASRLITNIGGHVVKIGEEQEDRSDAQRCLVLAEEDLLDSFTVRIISSAFKCNIAKANTEKYRAKLVLFLGNKFAQQFYSR